MSLSGLLRSLVIYRARPWRIAQFAKLYANFVKPGDLAFDVGAHVGNRTLALKRAGASVVALEPQDLFYRFLKATLPKDITALKLAAGPATATTTLSVSRRHPTVSSLAPNFAKNVVADESFAGVTWDVAQQVEMTTLDALIDRFGQPEFIKIDVEGYEADVLSGLTKSVSAIAFEYLPAMIAEACAAVDQIGRLGTYRFNIIRGEKLEFELPAWQPPQALKDWLHSRQAHRSSGDVYARLEKP